MYTISQDGEYEFSGNNFDSSQDIYVPTTIKVENNVKATIYMNGLQIYNNDGQGSLVPSSDGSDINIPVTNPLIVGENAEVTINLLGDSTLRINENFGSNIDDNYLKNCYYINAFENSNQGNSSDSDDMATAEMAYSLNTSNGNSANSKVWTYVDGDNYPTFANEENKAVCSVKFEYGGTVVETRYSDSTGKIIFPDVACNINEKVFWFKDGKIISEDIVIDSDCTIKTIIMAPGWEKVDGTWYYYSSTKDNVLKGWGRIRGVWYYFNKDGEMQTGWQTIEDKEYYLGSHGVMVAGRSLNIGGTVYKFDENGVMVKAYTS